MGEELTAVGTEWARAHGNTVKETGSRECAGLEFSSTDALCSQEDGLASFMTGDVTYGFWK